MDIANRGRKGTATFERLLGVGLKLAGAQGLEKVRNEDVATAACCSSGLVYRYFRRREALTYALADALKAEFHRSLVAPAKALADPREQLRAFCAACFEVKPGTPLSAFLRAVLFSEEDGGADFLETVPLDLVREWDQVLLGFIRAAGLERGGVWITSTMLMAIWDRVLFQGRRKKELWWAVELAIGPEVRDEPATIEPS